MRYVAFNGVRRSGNHIVLYWLQQHERGLTFHCNEVFRMEQEGGVGGKNRVFFTVYEDGAALDYDDPTYRRYREQYIGGEIQPDHLYGSTEDRTFASLPPRWWPGAVLPDRFVFVVRSFYNVAASRVEFTRRNHLNPALRAAFWRPEVIDLWIDHARRAKEPGRWLPVLYDRFIRERHYRRELRRRLGLPQRREEDLDFVPRHGFGSSFSAWAKPGSALRGEVNRRFETIDRWPAGVLESDEARELNHSIFGWALDQAGRYIE